MEAGERKVASVGRALLLNMRDGVFGKRMGHAARAVLEVAIFNMNLVCGMSSSSDEDPRPWLVAPTERTRPILHRLVQLDATITLSEYMRLVAALFRDADVRAWLSAVATRPDACSNATLAHVAMTEVIANHALAMPEVMARAKLQPHEHVALRTGAQGSWILFHDVSADQNVLVDCDGFQLLHAAWQAAASRPLVLFGLSCLVHALYCRLNGVPYREGVVLRALDPDAVYCSSMEE